MADVFISYRRRPSASLALLVQAKLQTDHQIDAYVDTTRTDSTRVQFPERLMQAIDDAPVFLCLLGEGTLESEWVRKEIDRAHQHHKFCIPVFQESYTPIDHTTPAIDYLLNHDGVHIFDQKNVMVNESMNQLRQLIEPHRHTKNTAHRRIIASAVFALTLISISALALFANNTTNTPNTTPDVIVAENATATATNIPADTLLPTATFIMPQSQLNPDIGVTLTANATLCATNPRNKPIDLMLVLDNSASMQEIFNNDMTRIQALQHSAETIANRLTMQGDVSDGNAPDQISIIAFADVILATIAYTPEEDIITDYLSTLYTADDSLISYGLSTAFDVFQTSQNRRPEATQIIIVMLDSDSSEDASNLIQYRDALENTGANLYAIGLDADMDETLLEAIASVPERRWIAKDYDTLQTVLEAIFLDAVGCL